MNNSKDAQEIMQQQQQAIQDMMKAVIDMNLTPNSDGEDIENMLLSSLVGGMPQMPGNIEEIQEMFYAGLTGETSQMPEGLGEMQEAFSSALAGGMPQMPEGFEEMQRMFSSFTGGISQMPGAVEDIQSFFQELAEGRSDQEVLEFIAAHPVPEDLQKYLMIGALLIGTNDEPYTTLALMEDKDFYRYELQNAWEIEKREQALEMLESLMAGRHSSRFAGDYEILREYGPDAYFEHAGDEPGLDDDDIESYEAAIEGFVEALDLPEDIAANCTTLLAWDLDRVGLLARMLSHVGFITDTEAYEWLKKAGKSAAERFASWEEYFVSLLLGRALHLGTALEPFSSALDLLTDSRELLEAYPISSLK